MLVVSPVAVKVSSVQDRSRMLPKSRVPVHSPTDELPEPVPQAAPEVSNAPVEAFFWTQCPLVPLVRIGEVKDLFVSVSVDARSTKTVCAEDEFRVFTRLSAVSIHRVIAPAEGAVGAEPSDRSIAPVPEAPT